MLATDYLRQSLLRLSRGEDIEHDAGFALEAIWKDEATPAQIAAFLTLIRQKQETATELYSMAETLRRRMQVVAAPDNVVDCCGTGGDGSHSLNISTTTALVVAACGVRVAKHGNRAVSSQSGSADILEKLGVGINLSTTSAAHCLQEAGIVFLAAPVFHPIMQKVGAIRKELGFRTSFNILGPMLNPANVKHQLMGVFSANLLHPVAGALQLQGSKRAWVVCSHDGLDEISISAPTRVAELVEGKIRRFTIDPSWGDLPLYPLGACRGGDVADNARAMLGLLRGEKGAYRDAVLLNSAALLCIAQAEPATPELLQSFVKKAAEALDSGQAFARLQALIKLSGAS
ncbi:MAG: anthranilate phosphoribosyltransferase [Alphaproteobacteria bacterium]